MAAAAVVAAAAAAVVVAVAAAVVHGSASGQPCLTLTTTRCVTALRAWVAAGVAWRVYVLTVWV